jgi:hypothetical protein
MYFGAETPEQEASAILDALEHLTEPPEFDVWLHQVRRIANRSRSRRVREVANMQSQSARSLARGAITPRRLSPSPPMVGVNSMDADSRRADDQLRRFREGPVSGS